MSISHKLLELVVFSLTKLVGDWVHSFLQHAPHFLHHEIFVRFNGVQFNVDNGNILNTNPHLY